MTHDPCRFCRYFAVALAMLSVLLGVLAAAQFAVAGTGAGGGQLSADSVVALLRDSATGSLSPAATGSAVLVALVLWAQGLAPAALQRELPNTLRRAGLVSLPGYLLSVVLCAGLGALLACLLLSAPLSSLVALLPGLPARLAAGALSTAFDVGLLCLLSWRFLAVLRASRLSLPAQLALALAATALLRALVALLVAPLLPR